MAGEPTFVPPVAPSFGLEDQREPRIRVLQFGDGYMQRTRDGINHDQESMTWKWENLTFAEYSSIWGFFVARGGDQAFLYTVPWGTTGNVQKKYIALKYERSRDTAGAYNVRASVREVSEG
jgi:phage-related protein